MTRRERPVATLRGEPVDRPPVSFYEVGGCAVNPDDPDPYNIYNGPTSRPLLDLAEQRTALIRMHGPGRMPAVPGLYEEFFRHETWEEGDARLQRTTLRVAGRMMTGLTRRDAPVSTVWTIEHLLKNADDARAYLEIPDEAFLAVPVLQPLVVGPEYATEPYLPPRLFEEYVVRHAGPRGCTVCRTQTRRHGSTLP